MQVLSFLRCDRTVSAGAGKSDPKPCISFVLNKLLSELKQEGINSSKQAIYGLLKRECSGHYNLSISQSFLPEGSSATTIPSKRSKSGREILKCVQIHKSVLDTTSLKKLEEGMYIPLCNDYSCQCTCTFP